MPPNPSAHLQAEATTSCLEHTVIAGKIDLLQLLMTGGADLNKTITENGLNENIYVPVTSRKTLLHLAATYAEEIMIKILLKASINAVIEGSNGNTANKLSTLSVKPVVYRYEKDRATKLEENEELEVARRVDTAKGVEAAE